MDSPMLGVTRTAQHPFDAFVAEYSGYITIGIALIIIWDITWKGIGMWKAAKNGSKPWFIAILILNTMGVLPIIYYFICKYREAKQTVEQENQTK